MFRFPWEESYELGIGAVDEQHRKLVAIIDHLYVAMQENRSREALSGIFTALDGYVTEHFATEERLMREHRFPGEELHGAQHSEFTARVRLLRAEHGSGSNFLMSIQVVLFLKAWLLEHMLQSDRELCRFLQSQGVG